MLFIYLAFGLLIRIIKIIMVRLEPNPIGSTITHINAGEELASHYSDFIKHPIQLHVLSSTVTKTNFLGKEVRIPPYSGPRVWNPRKLNARPILPLLPNTTELGSTLLSEKCIGMSESKSDKLSTPRTERDAENIYPLKTKKPKKTSYQNSECPNGTE
jgi:hypothetical protein